MIRARVVVCQLAVESARHACRAQELDPPSFPFCQAVRKTPGLQVPRRRTMRLGRPERGVAASGVPTTVMPANLTPEYRAAEAALRKARDPRDRLDCLREMLRVMPKHKGTDHLQGDIRRRIKELSEELERPRRGGGHGGPALVFRPEGAAQIPVLGPPNARKSSLHARLPGPAR